MKNLMKLFVLVAAAAMALASCQKNEFETPIENGELHFTIKAGIETKTSIADNGDGTYSPSWKNGDQIGIFFTEPEEKVEKVDATFSNTNQDGPEASFEGKATVEGEGTFYAFYPASAFDQHYGDETIRLDLPAAQKPTSTSFDPACDILVAKPCDYLADGETVVINDLYFARLMSVLRINLVGEFAKGEIVESLTFSVDGVDITGNAKVDYKNATITAWNNGNVDRSVVTASYAEDRYITIAEGNNAAYLVVAPTTIPEGTNLTFAIKTANYNISKTVAAPAEMTFTAGNVSKINLTIGAENCEKIDQSIDYSGEYLIAGKEGDKWYAAKKYTSGNYLSVSEIEFIGENIVETETISDHYMTINKIDGGTYDGMYTIVDAGGKYLSTSSSDSNYMKAEEAASKNTYWTIMKDDATGTYSIVASKSEYTRNDMRFNYNNGSNSRVSCYDGTKTSQPYLTLFSTSLVKPDTTPKISVTNTAYSVKATDTSVEIPYTVKNITDAISASVADGATMSNVSANVTEGKVTVSFAANEESAEKTATIVLSYDGATPVNVTLTQAAKPAEGEPKEVVDVLTRALTGISGTSYSNWSGKTVTSSAVYAGNSAGGNDAIQLRSNNSNSGVVTTTSGGYAKKVKVTWNSNTSAGRTLDVYGKNTAYSNASDLYNSSQGTKLGSIKIGTSTELEITGDYQYIGLRSSSGALYLTDVSITWSTSAGNEGGETPDPTPEPDPDPTPEPEPDPTPDPETNGYTKYTGELVEGDYIIVYSDKAMKATVSSNRLGYDTVTPSNDVISDPNEAIVWHIAKSGSYWTIYNASVNKYAASTGTKNQAALNASGTDDKSLWTVSGTATYEFVNKNNKSKSVNANLRNNGTYGFACYSTSTGGALTLYKKN